MELGNVGMKMDIWKEKNSIKLASKMTLPNGGIQMDK